MVSAYHSCGCLFFGPHLAGHFSSFVQVLWCTVVLVGVVSDDGGGGLRSVRCGVWVRFEGFQHPGGQTTAETSWAKKYLFSWSLRLLRRKFDRACLALYLQEGPLRPPRETTQ